MLHFQQGRAAGKTWWNRWLSKGPGQEGEELDDEDVMFFFTQEGRLENMNVCTTRSFGKDEERWLENLKVRTTQLSSFLEVPPLFVLLEYSLGML